MDADYSIRGLHRVAGDRGCADSNIVTTHDCLHPMDGDVGDKFYEWRTKKKMNKKRKLKYYEDYRGIR